MRFSERVDRGTRGVTKRFVQSGQSTLGVVSTVTADTNTTVTTAMRMGHFSLILRGNFPQTAGRK